MSVSSVSDIGDLNNDGLADLLVGAPGNRYFDDETGTERRGAAYVVFGKMAGDTVDLADVKRFHIWSSGALSFSGLCRSGREIPPGSPARPLQQHGQRGRFFRTCSDFGCGPGIGREDGLVVAAAAELLFSSAPEDQSADEGGVLV